MAEVLPSRVKNSETMQRCIAILMGRGMSRTAATARVKRITRQRMWQLINNGGRGR